jgi:hypothetical protein
MQLPPRDVMRLDVAFLRGVLREVPVEAWPCPAGVERLAILFEPADDSALLVALRPGEPPLVRPVDDADEALADLLTEAADGGPTTGALRLALPKGALSALLTGKQAPDTLWAACTLARVPAPAATFDLGEALRGLAAWLAPAPARRAAGPARDLGGTQDPDAPAPDAMRHSSGRWIKGRPTAPTAPTAPRSAPSAFAVGAGGGMDPGTFARSHLVRFFASAPGS